MTTRAFKSITLAALRANPKRVPNEEPTRRAFDEFQNAQEVDGWLARFILRVQQEMPDETETETEWEALERLCYEFSLIPGLMVSLRVSGIITLRSLDAFIELRDPFNWALDNVARQMEQEA